MKHERDKAVRIIESKQKKFRKKISQKNVRMLQKEFVEKLVRNFTKIEKMFLGNFLKMSRKSGDKS